MRYLLTLILLTNFLSAEENKLSLQYTSLSYKNSPNNHFYSLYLDMEEVYTFMEGDLELRLGINALGVLGKSDDFYLFDTVSKSKIAIKSLSLDYYPSDQVLLSLGRQSLDINLLRGSFDGLLVAATVDDFSLKAFYFEHYSTLYPTYYKNADFDKLYGLNFQYSGKLFESELSYFTYYGHTVQNVYMAVHPGNVTLGAEYLAFTSDLLHDEKAYKLHLGYQYENFYAEMGYYHVYEGTLRNIFAVGGSEFQNYRLHGFLDQSNAKNIYLDLQYKQNDFSASLHFGRTEFEMSYDPTQTYTGKELGISLSKRYDDFSISASLLTQKSDQPWDTGERTTWVQTQLTYRF